MKVGIAGYSGSGKSTVFQWLTGATPDHAKAQLGQVGVARIPDARLDWLSEKFSPRKTTPATLEFLDTPGLLPTERRDNPRRLAILREGNTTFGASSAIKPVRKTGGASQPRDTGGLDSDFDVIDVSFPSHISNVHEERDKADKLEQSQRGSLPRISSVARSGCRAISP